MKKLAEVYYEKLKVGIEFRKYEMKSIFWFLLKRLMCWTRGRYKRYKTSVNRAYKWLEKVQEQFHIILPLENRII